ncbi:MAG: DUF4810 domain-containing protein [Thermodesulfovibrionia bacterium]|nr:DUF4810 domain-containing protein [Thermodesulfovibrionia bacterium]
MKKVYLILLFLASYFFLGCATQKPMYFWGNYSSSLYGYKKTPNEENLLKHKQELLQIIEKSKARGLRVPPGVYCEYGYILMKEGKNKEALQYYDLEEQTYPESKIFIQNLKSQINQNME